MKNVKSNTERCKSIRKKGNMRHLFLFFNSSAVHLRRLSSILYKAIKLMICLQHGNVSAYKSIYCDRKYCDSANVIVK